MSRERLRRTVPKFLLVTYYLSGKPGKACLLVCHLVLLITKCRHVKVSCERINSSFRKDMEPTWGGSSFVQIWMEIRTMHFFTSCSVFAFFRLEKFWVIFLFFPTVRGRALVLLWAAFWVRSNNSVSLPLCAHFLCVRIKWWLSSIILPVVCVYTGFPIMIILFIRTPDGLKVEQVKVHVNCVLLNQFNWDFIFTMSKRTKLLIFTLVLCIRA